MQHQSNDRYAVSCVESESEMTNVHVFRIQRGDDFWFNRKGSEVAKKKSPSKFEIVLEAIKELTRQNGRCHFGLKSVSKQSGVPEIELWDWENDKGILYDLNDHGYIIIERGQHPSIALDSDTLC